MLREFRDVRETRNAERVSEAMSNDSNYLNIRPSNNRNATLDDLTNFWMNEFHKASEECEVN